MSKLQELHDTLAEIFEDARVHWAEDHAAGFKRKESYWQGKKDGLRVAMNLIYQLIGEEKDSTDR